jgi:hypothetical protein
VAAENQIFFGVPFFLLPAKKRNTLEKYRIVYPDSLSFAPQKVTMNHITEREQDLGDYKGQEPLAPPL